MRSLVLLSLAMVLTTAAHAQPGVSTPGRPTLTVSDEAVVSVAPDRAEIDIGVVTQATTAKEAADKNAVSVRAVIDQVKRALSSGADVQTVGYSIQPD